MERYLLNKHILISANKTGNQKTLGIGIGLFKRQNSLNKIIYLALGINLIFVYLTVGVKVKKECNWSYYDEDL